MSPLLGKSCSVEIQASEYLEYSYRTPSQPLYSTYPTPIWYLSDTYLTPM